MSVRASLVTFAVISLLGLAALLVAAAADQRSTAVSLDVPAAVPVAALAAGQEACQGPIETATEFGGVEVWIAPSASGGTTHAGLSVSVSVFGTDALLATGRIPVVHVGPSSLSAPLSKSVPPGRRLSICLRNTGPAPVTLLGAAPGSQSGVLTRAGQPTQLSLALVLLRDRPKSLLSLLPTVFQRAALWRPGSVGSWTFWALSAAFVAAFVVAGLAVARAVRSDL